MMPRTTVSVLWALTGAPVRGGDVVAGDGPASKPADTTLFMFENEADVKNWSALTTRRPSRRIPTPGGVVEGRRSSRRAFDEDHARRRPVARGDDFQRLVTDWTPFYAVEVEGATSRPASWASAPTPTRRAADAYAHRRRRSF